MPVDPIQEVVNDLRRRFKDGERRFAVPLSWRRYFAGVNERLFGGRT